MKQPILLCFLLILIAGSSYAQPLRYFEIRTECGHGEWRDTSFIVGTASLPLIAATMAELAKPYSDRKFINGELDYGNAGYNHNASHWFRWHIKPDAWTLTEFAIEVCDGCPYTDVDQDTATWVGTIGQFCPWTGRPYRELTDPTMVPEQPLFPELKVWPVPAMEILQVQTGNAEAYQLELYDIYGKELLTQYVLSGIAVLQLDQLAPGGYLLRISNEHGSVQRMVQKL